MQARSLNSQSGAIFANLALGVAAMGSVAAVATDWTAQQSALALQRQQGYLFATLNDSVGNYMTLLFPQLTEKAAAGGDAIPADCAKVPYRYGRSEAVERVILEGKCKLSLPLSAGGTYVVFNAFQPTLVDLKALGLLDHGISSTPVLSTELLVSGPDETGLASATLAANGYAIAITPKCVGRGGEVADCTNSNKALTSSVINIQPFAQSKYIQNFMPMMWAAGPDAAMSGPPDASNVLVPAERTNPTGEFRSIQAGWSRDNPITRSWSYSTSSGAVTYSRGVDNLLVMRNGYDSAYWQLTRRDGASPPTADWNFDGKALTNVGKLTAASAEISGDLKIGGNQTIAGNQSVGGDQTVAGKLDVDGKGTFKGVLSAMSDLVVKGSSELQGKLTVVGFALFKGDVKLEKSLQVVGATQLDGALTGTSASFSGALTASSLVIGSTQITRDGTLLGSTSGWGVNSGSSCSSNLALAQSSDGKLQICRNSSWTALVLNENMVVSAPGAGQSCAPEGAPGRLPDGTLAVCRGGVWESTTQGSVSVGSVCSVEGSLATGTVGSSSNTIVMGCRGGKWATDVFTKPRLGYATQGNSCPLNDEMALDGRGYPSLLVCKEGKWQPPGTQLLSGMVLGDSCTLDGVLAGDIVRTGLLVCRGGAWRKVTSPLGPVAVGAACNSEGLDSTDYGGPQVTINPDSSGRGTIFYCDRGRWSDYPPNLTVHRIDGMVVNLLRHVDGPSGDDFYLYSHPGWPNGRAQTMDNIGVLIWGHGGYASEVYQGMEERQCSRAAWSDKDPDSNGVRNRYTVCVVSDNELYGINGIYGGRPAAWNFDFDGGAEIWTARRRDSCSDWGCDVQWGYGGSGGWSDHVTIDLWNNHTFLRWNTDARPVVLKVTRQ